MLLADKISSKYDKYINTTSNYDNEKPFGKKNYYEAASYEKTRQQSSKYATISSQSRVSNNSKVSERDMERKRSSYLNTITELYG